MSKTIITMALGQLPDNVSGPFKALYPELVHETPCTIEIDPDKRSINFTVGAREMSFGPSNENYSVFLLGCYRMLSKAAQESGWMSQYAAENAAQAASPASNEAQPAAPETQPAAPTVASPDASAKVAALKAKVASLPQTPEVVAFAAKLASVEGKVKTASVSTASTTVVPKPNHELYVRPLDFVGALRDDWNAWAAEHGGKDTMHEHGVLDLQVPPPDAVHHASVSDLSNLSGWNHEASTWSNPKGLKTANDSKLVSQLRSVVSKKASFNSLDEVKNAVRSGKSVFWKAPNYKVTPEAANGFGITCLTNNHFVGLSDDYNPEDFYMGNSSEENAHNFLTSQGFSPAQADDVIAGYGPEYVQKNLADLKREYKVSSTHAADVDGEAQLMSHTDNPVEKLADGPTSETKIIAEDTVGKTASTQEVATAKSACSQDFRVGSAAPGPWVVINDSTGEVVKECANKGEATKVYNKLNAKDEGFSMKAKSYHEEMQPKKASVKKAYSPEVSSAARQFVEQNAGGRFSIDTLKSALSNISSSWKDVASYLKDSKLLQSDGPGFFKILNRDTAEDQNVVGRRFASRKIARECNAEPKDITFGPFDITIDCPAGAMVSGTDKDGNPWQREQSVDYGEISDTVGGDGEPIDVFMGSDESSPWVFIVNQTKPEGEETLPDEIKVGLGFWTLEEARDAYLSMFDAGWSNYDPNLVTTTLDAFKDWVMSDKSSAPEVSADDFNSVEEEAPVQQPVATVTDSPEPVNFFSSEPTKQYIAASVKEIHAASIADTLTVFRDPSSQGLDHTAANLATLLSGVQANPLRGHRASAGPSIENAVRVSHEAKTGELIAVASSSRIAEIITNELNCGMSPEDCDHRASTVGYYGADAKSFRSVLARVAGIAGELVLQPNFIKNSCVNTYNALATQHKATRSKTPYHAVASTSKCASCSHHVSDSTGGRRCTLYKKPIVASVEEMHSLADKVWGKSASKDRSAKALSKRAVAHIASKRSEPEQASFNRVTAATGYADRAEDRPTPKVATQVSTPELSPRAYVSAALSQGQTPARIAEVLDRSVTLQPSFKKAALSVLDSQKGLMGFLTVLPHFAGNCSATYGKHFAKTAKTSDKRKTAYYSVTKISACDGCSNNVKTATSLNRCSLHGKPLVASLNDLKQVVGQSFPALQPKLASMSKDELVEATLPYLAKSLGLPEGHPSLKGYSDVMPTETPLLDPEVEECETPKVDGASDVIEGASKNVMDLALEASKPKTEDLEDITVKVKEAAAKNMSSDKIYESLKGKIAGMDNRDLKVYVNRIASTYLNEVRSSTGEVYTEVVTTDKNFSQTLSDMAKNQIQVESPAMSDGVVDLAEMGQEPQGVLELGQLDDAEPKLF